MAIQTSHTCADPQTLNLTALEAAALARLDAAQRAARQQLMAVLSKRRLMDVAVRLEAPKVAVPVLHEDGTAGACVEVLFSHAHVDAAMRRTYCCDAWDIL